MLFIAAAERSCIVIFASNVMRRKHRGAELIGREVLQKFAVNECLPHCFDLDGGKIAMTEAPFHDRPPLTDRVNAYDEQHLAIYLRLLMAEEEGADWREVVLVLFGLDPAQEPAAPKSSMTAIWRAPAG